MNIKIVNTVSISEVKEEIIDLENALKVCQICDLQVESEEMVKHVAHEHNKCFHCELALGSKSAIWQHLLLVHKVKIYQECRECRQKFSTVQDLDEHSKSHEPVKEFKCDLCEFKSTLQTIVDQHVKEIRQREK